MVGVRCATPEIMTPDSGVHKIDMKVPTIKHAPKGSTDDQLDEIYGMISKEQTITGMHSLARINLQPQLSN